MDASASRRHISPWRNSPLPFGMREFSTVTHREDFHKRGEERGSEGGAGEASGVLGMRETCEGSGVGAKGHR